ncbi:hypothetical protein [Haloferax sulfurifontis]|uniref:hypothetical protein n=1 Tax=Haloferax sulfurifontis TaxID=255616 RepID=UPI001375EC7F|nr:hypothetical protein [Haloferax sulfurifontis]
MTTATATLVVAEMTTALVGETVTKATAAATTREEERTQSASVEDTYSVLASVTDARTNRESGTRVRSRRRRRERRQRRSETVESR